LGLRKVDAVMHLVDDVYEAVSFYETVMGLKRGWTDDENKMVGLLFPGNDTELVLHMNKNLPNPNVSFQVEDVESFVEEFKAKGYKVLVEPFDIRCGKCTILEDPYGNELEVMDITKFDDVPRFDE
jgi:lactoylglutathione lyase